MYAIRSYYAAASLRRFVTHDGIQGSFRIRYDQNGRLQEIVAL